MFGGQWYCFAGIGSALYGLSNLLSLLLVFAAPGSKYSETLVTARARLQPSSCMDPFQLINNCSYWLVQPSRDFALNRVPTSVILACIYTYQYPATSISAYKHNSMATLTGNCNFQAILYLLVSAILYLLVSAILYLLVSAILTNFCTYQEIAFIGVYSTKFLFMEDYCTN